MRTYSCVAHIVLVLWRVPAANASQMACGYYPWEEEEGGSHKGEAGRDWRELELAMGTPLFLQSIVYMCLI